MKPSEQLKLVFADLHKVMASNETSVSVIAHLEAMTDDLLDLIFMQEDCEESAEC